MEKYFKLKRSYRSFHEDKKISKEDLKEILDTQIRASRAANRQSLRYIAVLNEKKVNFLTDISKFAGLLKNDAGRPGKGKRPSAYIAILKDSSKRADTDAGIVTDLFQLKAIEKNIGSLIIGSVDKKRFEEEFEMPAGFSLHSILAFGYPDHESSILICDDENPVYERDENGDYKVFRIKTEKISSREE